ncbi:TPA: phage tail length tape measure family protein, partial [Enterobacter hormaechei subsp. xiangfangensis]
MSNDIATISLRVNTSELERGNQALDRFQESASAAAGKADDLNSTFRTGIDNQKKNSESLKQQRQELQNLLNKISPVNKALDELDIIQESLAKFRSKGLVGDEDFTRYNSVLETTRAKLAQVMESETAEGRARIEQAQAAQRAAAAGKTFIDSLEDQVSAIGKTRAELLELTAAQLGVSDRAAPMIARLKEQEESWKSGAISAGQYRNAMRYLPMQMTDIVTSLASGMPVYMVAIQQGGQLRDSFGGVGNALKAMLSMVTPARVAIGGLAGAVLIAAKAGSDYFTAYDEINKAIIRTGNIAGTSALQIMASSQSISASTGATVGTVQSLMTELVGIGSMTQQQLEKATKATALAVETGIVSAQDITKAYKDIEKDPVKALQNLNEQFNFLTVSQLKHIDELVKQKDQTAAVTQAMGLFGDTMAER